MRPRRRRISDSQSARQHLLEAGVTSRVGRAHGVHEPRAAARQIAEPARVEGQPGDPSSSAAPPTRAEISRYPYRSSGPRAVCAGTWLRTDAAGETVGTTFAGADLKVGPCRLLDLPYGPEGGL